MRQSRDAIATPGSQLRFSRRLAVAHVAGIAGLVLVVLGSILYVSREHNVLARASSVQLVQSGVEAFRSKMRTVVKDYSIWDEAYAAIRDGDADWLYSNVGSGAAEIGALDVIVLVKPATGEEIGWRNGSPAEGETGLIPAPLLATVLDILAERVPPASLGRTAGQPEAVTLFARMEGDLWIFAATRVRPIAGVPADLADAMVPRQVHGLRVSDSLLRVLRETLLIDDLGIAEPGMADGAFVMLPGPDNTPLAALVWAPPRPGASILREIALPLAAALLIATALAWATSRSIVRSARQLEIALDAAQIADRSKTEFLSNVSHELRTPMNGIIGAAQLLEMSELNPEQRDLVQILRTSSRLQMALISDLIDLTQIESGNRRLAEEPFDARGVCLDVAEIVRPTAETRALRLDIDVAALEGLELVGDERALRQILLNLLGNAVKFTQEGSVSLAVDCDHTPEGAALAFRVADTGPGIDPEHHRAIFSRFYQVDGSLARQAEGTGLGLAISASLADMMGGRIEIDSALGRGSIFTFRALLPVAAPVRLAREALAGGRHAA